MENKYIDQKTDADRKNYVWNTLLTDYNDDDTTAADFWAETPLTSKDVNFYLEDQTLAIRNRFHHLKRITPKRNDNSLIAKYQRSFIKAANAAYQNPKETEAYLKDLDSVASELHNVVLSLTPGGALITADSVSKINKQIKTAHNDRPIDSTQNAFNIAAMIVYLAICLTALTLSYIFPVMPLALLLTAYAVAIFSGGATGYMFAKSYNGFMGVTEKQPLKFLFMSWDNKNPHTVFTPKTKALRHAKSISNIASRKDKMDTFSENVRGLNPFRSKAIEV